MTPGTDGIGTGGHSAEPRAGVGVSTYAFAWRIRHAQEPSSLSAMIGHVRELGASVLQICDHSPVESMTDSQLREVRAVAADHGVTLELGTRGVDAATMDRYLDLARILGAGLVRTMYAKIGEQVTRSEFEHGLARATARYAEAGVRIAVENYEQISVPDLVEVIGSIDDPHLGVCLDPANSIAALERPGEVVRAAAPYVTNVHVKDFGFGRREGGFGFEVTGRRLGDGVLDHVAMLDAIAPRLHEVNLVVEHWLPRQDTADATCAVEDDWTRHAVEVLTRYLDGRTDG